MKYLTEMNCNNRENEHPHNRIISMAIISENLFASMAVHIFDKVEDQHLNCTMYTIRYGKPDNTPSTIIYEVIFEGADRAFDKFTDTEILFRPFPI